MMVFLAQLARVEGYALPLSFYIPPRLKIHRPLYPLLSKTSEIMLPNINAGAMGQTR
jgi:hypothetical protein